MSPPPLNGDGVPDNLGNMPPSRTLPPYSSSKRSNAPPRLDKKQIEQRIEEDRERHKRQRENIWAVPPGEDAEMEKLWEETSDLGEDDHRMGEEEWAEWKAEFDARRCSHRRTTQTGRTETVAANVLCVCACVWVCVCMHCMAFIGWHGRTWGGRCGGLERNTTVLREL